MRKARYIQYFECLAAIILFILLIGCATIKSRGTMLLIQPIDTVGVSYKDYRDKVLEIHADMHGYYSNDPDLVIYIDRLDSLCNNNRYYHMDKNINKYYTRSLLIALLGLLVIQSRHIDSYTPFPAVALYLSSATIVTITENILFDKKPISNKEVIELNNIIEDYDRVIMAKYYHPVMGK